jgi:hypothetical protein
MQLQMDGIYIANDDPLINAVWCRTTELEKAEFACLHGEACPHPGRPLIDAGEGVRQLVQTRKKLIRHGGALTRRAGLSGASVSAERRRPGRSAPARPLGSLTRRNDYTCGGVGALSLSPCSPPDDGEAIADGAANSQTRT